MEGLNIDFIQTPEEIDNLFIAVSITGQYFFYAKLSNDANWPNFLG